MVKRPAASERCPLCRSGRLRSVAHPHTITIAGAVVEGSVCARACAGCHEVLVPPEEIAGFEALAAAALIRAGWLRGGVLRAARKALGYPANQLAALLGVAPETVSRWEHGTRDVPRAVFLWLHELCAHHVRRSTESHDPVMPIEPLDEPPRLRLPSAA